MRLVHGKEVGVLAKIVEDEQVGRVALMLDDDGRELKGGKRELNVVERYLQRLGEQLAAVEVALMEANWERVDELTAEIRRGASRLGLGRIQRFAKELEIGMHEKDDVVGNLDRLITQLDELGQVCHNVMQVVDEDLDDEPRGA